MVFLGVGSNLLRRAADERADDGANFLGADGSADGGLYACADGVLVLIRLRHPGADRAAFVRAVAVTDAGAVGSAVGRRSGDKAARTDTYFPFKFIRVIQSLPPPPP